MATDLNGVILGPIPPGIPHFLIPFSIGETGAAQTVQQGSVTEIIQSVSNLIGTRPGTRLMVPKYGVPDPTFLGLNVPALQLAVATYEKRAVVSAEVTPGNEEQVVVSVAVAPGTPS